MSRKREKKIKRLRKTSLIPQIIETFVVEVAFLIIVGLVAFTEATSYLQNVVTKNAGTCRQIVASVEKGWDSSKKQLSGDTEEYLKNILSYSREDFESICLVDNDRNILVSYGNSVPDDSFYKYYSDKEFNKNGVYFREELFESLSTQDYEEYEEYEDDMTIDLIDDDSNNFKMYRKLFLGSSDDTSLTKKEYYDWATSNSLFQTFWVMYKTDIDGINVLINKVYYQKKIDSARQTFLMLIMGIVFIFIALYEHYRLIVVIVNRRKIQKLIYTDPVTGGQNKDYFIKRQQDL